MERNQPSGPQPIASVLRQFLRESGLHRPSGDERVFRAWSEAAGGTWKEHALPASFRAGQLVVEVTSSVHLSELKSFHGERIRARANATLGEARIQKVVFKLKS